MLEFHLFLSDTSLSFSLISPFVLVEGRCVPTLFQLSVQMFCSLLSKELCPCYSGFQTLLEVISPRSQYVLILPLPFISTSPLSSNLKQLNSSSMACVASDTWIFKADGENRYYKKVLHFHVIFLPVELY